MNFYSLNKKAPNVSFKEAVIKGLAPDKGLYFPESITPLDKGFFSHIEYFTNNEIAYEVIKQFVADEIQTLIDNGMYQNINIPNKNTISMEAGILQVTADLQAMYPTAVITLINGTRSGSTYTFTFQITVNASTVTIQTVVATFI